jgi:hypothetical protein
VLPLLLAGIYFDLLAGTTGLHTIAGIADFERGLLAVETDSGQGARAAIVLAGYGGVVRRRRLQFYCVRWNFRHSCPA